MSENKFTILIPTRERADTLLHSIKTCLDQNYNNFEVIVSDNCSSDNTKEVVDQFKDQGVKYIKTPERLSMTKNFEFAIQQVKEGFVTTIGDDDGLVPNSLPLLNDLINKHKVKAIAWKPAIFYWSNIKVEDYRGLFKIPLDDRYYTITSQELLEKIATDLFSSTWLPCIYWGFVHIDVINASKKDNQFLHSYIPDVYAGMVCAGQLDKYLYSKRPFSIS